MPFDLEELRRILGCGYGPIEERVTSALEALGERPASEVVPVVDDLIATFKSQLDREERHLTGSGCQQDLIEPYARAYRVAMRLRERYDFRGER